MKNIISKIANKLGIATVEQIKDRDRRIASLEQHLIDLQCEIAGVEGAVENLEAAGDPDPAAIVREGLDALGDVAEYVDAFSLDLEGPIGSMDLEEYIDTDSVARTVLDHISKVLAR